MKEVIEKGAKRWKEFYGKKKFFGKWVTGFIAFKCPECGKTVSLPTEHLLVWSGGILTSLHIYCPHCEEVYQLPCVIWKD